MTESDEFGRSLRAWREGAEETREALSNVMGCSRALVWQIEEGRAPPPGASTCDKIAAFLDLDPVAVREIAAASALARAFPLDDPEAAHVWAHLHARERDRLGGITADEHELLALMRECDPLPAAMIVLMRQLQTLDSTWLFFLFATQLLGLRRHQMLMTLRTVTDVAALAGGGRDAA